MPVQARALSGGVASGRVGSDDVLLAGCPAVSASRIDYARPKALRRGSKGAHILCDRYVRSDSGILVENRELYWHFSWLRVSSRIVKDKKCGAVESRLRKN